MCVVSIASPEHRVTLRHRCPSDLKKRRIKKKAIFWGAFDLRVQLATGAVAQLCTWVGDGAKWAKSAILALSGKNRMVLSFAQQCALVTPGPCPLNCPTQNLLNSNKDFRWYAEKLKKHYRQPLPKVCVQHFLHKNGTQLYSY